MDETRQQGRTRHCDASDDGNASVMLFATSGAINEAEHRGRTT